MRAIREVREDELNEFARITIEAFPGMKVESQEARERMIERLSKVMKEPIVHFFGVYEDETLVGVMRCYDFTMKLHEARTLVGGLGGVAVDLRHKKERVAADMVRFYLDFYRRKGAALAALYPFRPDFYRSMGFGYGVKMNRYSFSPETLPANGVRARVEYLTAADREDIAACYDRFMSRTNGLIEIPPHVLDGLFTDPALHTVGYREAGALRGYLSFRFEPAPGENWLANNVQLRTLIYDDPAALAALLGFLRKQADQVDRVIFETQDDRFHHILADPRDGSRNLLAGLWHQTNTQGTGIMYRVIDVPQLFEALGQRNFGGTTATLRLDLTDTFLPENGGTYRLVVESGQARLEAGHNVDVTVAMDISDFSSLAVGAIDFDRLYTYGLATISDDAFVPVVNRLFHAEIPPWCLTSF